MLPALVAVVEAGGLTTANLPFLFELRFTKALIGSGVNPTYERATVDNTSVDFAYQRGDSTVLAELVSITTSAAVMEATRHEVDENGIAWSNLILTTAGQTVRMADRSGFEP